MMFTCIKRCLYLFSYLISDAVDNFRLLILVLLMGGVADRLTPCSSQHNERV